MKKRLRKKLFTGKFVVIKNNYNRFNIGEIVEIRFKDERDCIHRYINGKGFDQYCKQYEVRPQTRKKLLK